MHLRSGGPGGPATLPGVTRLSVLLPFLLTAALAGGAGAPPAQTVPPLPQGALEWNEDLPLASPVQAAQIAALIKRHSGVTCHPRQTQAPGHMAAPLSPVQNIEAFTETFVTSGQDPESPVTAVAYLDRDAGRQVGVLIVTPREDTVDAGHGVMLLIPDQPRQGRMTLLTCWGLGPVKLRPGLQRLNT